MRIIVCGGRHYSDASAVRAVLEEYADQDPTIVHGSCPTGADYLADQIALELGHKVERWPADWPRLGRKAGPMRNEQMARRGAGLCIAFPGGKGTADMVRRAEARDIPIQYVDPWWLAEDEEYQCWETSDGTAVLIQFEEES